MAKKYSVDLSVKGIDRLIKAVDEIKSTVKTVNKEFMKISVEWIKERALAYLSGHEQTGDLSNSFELEILDMGNYVVGIIRNTSDHAAYAEYGIGIVGERNPHPLSSTVGYEYNVDSEFKVLPDVYGSNRAWLFSGKPFSGYVGIRFLYNAYIDYITFGKDECIIKALQNSGV